MDSAALVRRYYDALDSHDYEALESLLDPAFVQCRPDRSFDGRAAFVQFMREDRPNPDTSHDLEAVVANGTQVAARGCVRADGETLFEFADFFECEDGQIVALETFAR